MKIGKVVLSVPHCALPQLPSGAMREHRRLHSPLAPTPERQETQERPAETSANVDDSAPPSVAQLAGRFREQAAAAKEKSPPNASHPPKIKVKSSPLIEKLQANLAFDPAALLPGASPKSPGLKAAVSPFQSPPSTPSSPGVRCQAGELEEVPVSFDQPPEGSHLPCYNKVRTRGSIKRRPPSRRFRRSQSDCGDLGGFRAPESSQENGAKEENGDEVFPSKSEAPGAPPPSEKPVGELGSQEKPPPRRTSSRTEKQEKGRAPGEAQHHQEAVGGSEEEAGTRPAKEEAVQPAPASNPEAANGCRSPTEEKPAGEQTEKSAEVKEERAENEEGEPGQRSQDAKGLAEGAAGEAPPSPPGGVEGGHSFEQGRGEEKDEEGAVLEPGCNPSDEAPKTEDDTPVQDTKM
ncbi:capZ-interacting protein isoform X3 [Felis catus]|uniref:capZ-interacting protein isoform X3 n=1 Tax=Felis catus TaxID=9685 RepID=UPI001D19D658|nr:capZ-interacting protein isoform X3 [Felis catus]